MEDREDREDSPRGSRDPRSGESVDNLLRWLSDPKIGAAVLMLMIITELVRPRPLVRRPFGPTDHIPSTDGYAWSDPTKWDAHRVTPWCWCRMCVEMRIRYGR